MPRSPNVASNIVAMTDSVYSALAHRLATFDGEVYPFHVGDTWKEPADGCRMQDLTVDVFPGMHRYAPPQGLAQLLGGIADRTVERTGVPTAPENVLVATGATGGLCAVAGAILEPDDEVLILSPYWPLISGIVRSFHGMPVDVPFIGEAESPESSIEIVERYRTDRSVALYLNTPNNPSGRVLPRSWIEALVAWAERHSLWIIADEVYEEYVYGGEHVYTRPLAPELTFSTHSFSKSYGMAGNRCGYIVGPTSVMPELSKVGTHTYYSTPTASQLAAIRALEGQADEWLKTTQAQYAEVGRDAARILGVAEPEGSAFLFLDVAPQLDERGLQGFLEDCVDRGLLLAPGPSFGPYPTHARLCFTASEPEITRRGLSVLAEILSGR
jgi:aspartate/methionine/tyrosine aminotransferase